MSFKTRVLSTDCPSYLDAAAREARCDFEAGYATVGYRLLWELLSILETEEEDDVVRWAYTFLTKATVDEVWQWLRTAVPHMMTLVPSRRRASFLRGFGDALMDARRESPQVWNSMVASL